MLKFEKGNENDLVGRIIVYSKLSKLSDDGKEPEDGSICVTLGTTDISDFIKIGAPKQIKEAYEEMRKKMPSQDEGNSITCMAHTWMAQGADYENEFNVEADIISAGTYTFPMKCMTANMAAATIYGMRFEDQIRRRFNASKSSHPELTAVYADIPKSEVTRHISTNYVGLMLDARRDKDAKRLTQLSSDMLRFCSKSPVLRDAYDLCRLIEAGCDLATAELVVKKMGAVILEDFVQAATLRDELKPYLVKIK